MPDNKAHIAEFQRIQAEDRRLCILRFLCEAEGGQANDFVMQRVLKRMGHAVARHVVRADFAFLAESHLIALESFGPDAEAATITGRGRDAAEGVLLLPGLQAPRGV